MKIFTNMFFTCEVVRAELAGATVLPVHLFR